MQSVFLLSLDTFLVEGDRAVKNTVPALLEFFTWGSQMISNPKNNFTCCEMMLSAIKK